MKRIVVFALILNAALLGVIAQQFIALAGDDGPLATRQNGDVNGDQILDMSDAVYLLIHLFNGGPEPVALADSPEVLDRLDTLEATQGALQQGLTDLEADLPSLVSNTVFEAIDLEWHGTFLYRSCCPRTQCPRTHSAESVWFEEPESMRGGVVAENGKIYFSTDRAGTLLVQGIPNGQRLSSIYLRPVDGACESGAAFGGTALNSSNGLITFVLPNCQPGEYEIEPRLSFDITGGCLGWEEGGNRELSSRANMRYLRVGYVD